MRLISNTFGAFVNIFFFCMCLRLLRTCNCVLYISNSSVKPASNKLITHEQLANLAYHPYSMTTEMSIYQMLRNAKSKQK